MVTVVSHRAAARAVARREEIPATERRQLLEMLGLLDGDGAVVPDIEDTSTWIKPNFNGTSHRVWTDVRPNRPPRSTVPPGLATLQPLSAVPAPKPKPKPTATAKPRPKPTPESALVRRTPTGRRARALMPIEHGTSNGAHLHRKRGGKPCPPCREAERLYQRAADVRRAEKAGRTPRMIGIRPPCGTTKGARWHRSHGETICTPCREAKRAAQKLYDARPEVKARRALRDAARLPGQQAARAAARATRVEQEQQAS